MRGASYGPIEQPLCIWTDMWKKIATSRYRFPPFLCSNYLTSASPSFLDRRHGMDQSKHADSHSSILALYWKSKVSNMGPSGHKLATRGSHPTQGCFAKCGVVVKS